MTVVEARLRREPREQRLVHVTGVVQGVGFRPFVHRLATRRGLAGWVRNESGEVEIALAGPSTVIDLFLSDLETQAPPLARIERIRVDKGTFEKPEGVFRILESREVANRRQPVPADVATCDACLTELLDPGDRRHGYPFITCTDCGPRYTVIESLPYDRERTTMRQFVQCEECRHEYETPGDRRHHSETNSCPACGPLLWTQLPGEPLERPSREDASAQRALRRAAGAIIEGAIVAVRGVGGFHLAVDATNDVAIRRLRERKHREAKPLALMVASLADARSIAHVSDAEAALLTDRRRPIVLLARRDDASVAPSVAPSLDSIGVMLPYAPLQHLLLRLVERPLVMTSGNISEEPIVAGLEEGLQRLDGIADLFLLHDREIESPVDDSVMRVIGGAPALIRRARGHAPLPISLGGSTPRPIIAVGGHLKSTFTVAADDRAFVSPHLGDLDNLETLEHFHATLRRYLELFRVTPVVAARDLHPGYFSTRIAEDLRLERTIAVQHHHAHIAAVLGEHSRHDRVLGIAFDGTGYGDDGTVWGAELMIADRRAYERVGHLRAAPLPGGELAVKSPWRSALGYLSLDPEQVDVFSRAFVGISDLEQAVAKTQLTKRLNTPMASSMGRLFDAAAAVLGVTRISAFEGEAAMGLESLAGGREGRLLPFPYARGANGLMQLDPMPLLEALGTECQRGLAVDDLAAAFHASVAAGTAACVADLCASHGIAAVALGGGVFQNARLTMSLRARLEERGLAVMTPRELPANDGGLSYGQAVVAAAQLRRELDE